MTRFCTWNLENFFITPHKDYPDRFLKTDQKVDHIVHVIKTIEADIFFLTEVGGEEDLEILCRDKLSEEYQHYFLKGNSNRGIELGALVKKSYLKENDLEVDVHSHAHSPISFNYPHEERENKLCLERGHKKRYRSHKLSRDLLEVHFKKAGDSHPLFILLGVHLKSKLDKEGIDWNGQRRRYAEAQFVREKYKAINKKHHFKVPIFLTGDFNGEAHKSKCDAEFRDLYQNDHPSDAIEDFTDLLDLPREQCVSFVGFDRAKRPINLQLDYFFVPQSCWEKLNKSESGFFRYYNENKEVYPLPQTPWERHALPSDHYPIVIEIKDLLQ